MAPENSDDTKQNGSNERQSAGDTEAKLVDWGSSRTITGSCGAPRHERRSHDR